MALLGEAGHATADATRDRVAATLHAAAASPEAADLVRHGRLTADLDPSGFGTASDGGDEAAVTPGRRLRRKAAAKDGDLDGAEEHGPPGLAGGGGGRAGRRPQAAWPPPTRPCWPPARPSGWSPWPTRPSLRPPESGHAAPDRGGQRRPRAPAALGHRAEG